MKFFVVATLAPFSSSLPVPPTPSPAASDNRPLKIVIITDWHNNPEYNASLGSACRCTHWPGTELQPGCELATPASEFGQYSCDSSPALSASSLRAAVQAMPEPDAVLVLGDLVTHDSPSSAFTHATFHNMSQWISEAFPSRPFACQTPLGNNDAFPNYGINNSDPKFYEPQAETAKEYCGMTDAEAQVFIAHGYYSRQLRPLDRLLILNTNLYASANAVKKTDEKLGYYPSSPGSSSSRLFEQIDPVTDPDPLGQFAWMEDQFRWAAENGGRVYIAAHIPPALDSFSRVQQWQPAFAKSYWDLIAKYPQVLGFHIFGHLHSAEVRAFSTLTDMYSQMQAAPALQILSSVSPIYASNPVFYTLMVEPRTRVANLTMHMFDLGKLQPGAEPVYVPLPPRPLDQTEGLISSNGRYLDLFDSFLSTELTPEEEASYEAFFSQYKAGYRGKGLPCIFANATFQDCSTCTGGCRLAFVCLQAFGTNEEDYEACVAKSTLV